jgi:hypothetical protein
MGPQGPRQGTSGPAAAGCPAGCQVRSRCSLATLVATAACRCSSPPQLAGCMARSSLHPACNKILDGAHHDPRCHGRGHAVGACVSVSEEPPKTRQKPTGHPVTPAASRAAWRTAGTEPLSIRSHATTRGKGSIITTRRTAILLAGSSSCFPRPPARRRSCAPNSNC